MKIYLPTFLPKLIISLVILFVIEEFIYGKLPIGPVTYVIAKSLSELFLYLLLGVIIAYKMVVSSNKGTRYHPTYFDYALLFFVALSIVSTIYNEGGFFNGLVTQRTMLRYVAIYYVIVITAWSPNDKSLRRVFSVIVAIAIFESGLGVVQHLAGDEFIFNYFATLKSELENIENIELATAGLGKKMGSAIGTFGKPAAMGFYLLAACVISISLALENNNRVKFKWMFAYLIILIGIYVTYKRGEVLLALITPFIVAIITRHKPMRKYLMISIPSVIILFVVLLTLRGGFGDTEYVKEKETQISVFQSLSQLFTAEYWQRTTTSSRGWVILEVGGEAISSFKPIGYGADEDNARAILARKGGAFAKLYEWHALDDVYIIAALVYYGPVGVTLLISCFVYIYISARKLSKYAMGIYRVLGVSISTLLILMLLGGFLERHLELRAFAFMFWALAGVVMVMRKYDDYHNFENANAPL